MKKLTNRAALFAMMRTLEQARIEFISADGSGGEGVRLRPALVVNI